MQNPVADGCRTGFAICIGIDTELRRRPAGRGVFNGAGLAGLLLLGAVLPAAPALAQNQPIVSNLSEGNTTSSAFARTATPFTTGDRVGGYTLTKLVISLRQANNSTVSIHDVSGNLPGASIGALAGPSAISAVDVYTYTSSAGIPLAASTTYYLVLGGQNLITFTRSADQTTADGWDISNRVTVWSTTNNRWVTGNEIGGPFVSLLAIRFSLSVRPFFDFGGSTIADQTYIAGTAIADLTLPTASSSGIGINSYTLEPDPPDGLSFNGNSNPPVLSGKPTTEMAAASYTYTATVASSSTSLNFTIRVLPPDAVKLRLRVFLEGPLQ